MSTHFLALSEKPFDHWSNWIVRAGVWGPILDFEFRIPQSEFRNSQVSLTENREPSVVRLALELRRQLQTAKGGSVETICN